MKYLISLSFLILFYSCGHKTTDLELIKEYSIDQKTKEHFGNFAITQNGKDIFIVNRISKKIFHYIQENDKLIFKDELKYGKLCQIVMDSCYKDEKYRKEIISQVYSQIGSQSILDWNENFWTRNKFHCFIDVAVWDWDSTNRREKLMGSKHFEYSYDNGFNLKELHLPDSLFSKENLYIVNGFYDHNKIFFYETKDGNRNKKTAKFTFLSIEDNKRIIKAGNKLFDLELDKDYEMFMYPLVKDKYIFSALSPFFYDYDAKKKHSFQSILPDSVFNYHHAKGLYNIFRTINETKDKIYFLTKYKSHNISYYYACSFDKQTLKGGVIGTLSFQERDDEHHFYFDNDNNLCVYKSSSDKVQVYKL